MRSVFASLIAGIALIGCTNGKDSDGGPCINVDGAGDFETVQAAIDAAAAGSTVFICEGAFNESATISKDLTIEGEGDDDSVWTAVDGSPALTISGGVNVTIARIGFAGNRDGIVVDGGALTLDRAGFFALGGFAVEATGADVTVSETRVRTSAFGGIQVTDGALTMSDSTFTDNTSFGVHIVDGTASLTGNEFTGSRFSGDGTNADDGWGVWLDNSPGILENNVFGENVIGDVSVTGANGTVDMTGDTSDGSYTGVWFTSTSGTLTDVSISNYQQYGIVQDGGQTLTLVNTTIATEPAISNTQDETTGFSGSYGIIALGADLDITGGLISGNTGAGIYQSTGNNTTVQLDMTGTVVDGNARYGVATFGGTMNLTDVAVTNTLDDDTTCLEEDGSIVCNMAIAAWTSDLTMVGGELSNNGTFGLTPVLSASAKVTNTQFLSAAASATWVFDSAFTCDNCLFDGSKKEAISLNNGAAGVLKNSTIQNSTYTTISDFDADTTAHFFFQAYDVTVFDSTLIVQNSKFSHGENGLYVAGGALEISDSTFEDYNQDVLYAAYDAALVVTNSTITNVGSDAVSCYSGEVSLEDVAITDVNSYQSKFEYYDSGVLNESWSSDTSTPGVGISGNSCRYEFEDVQLSGVNSAGLVLTDSAVAFDGLTVSDVAKLDSWTDGGIYLNYPFVAPDIQFTDVSVSGVTVGNGVEITGSTTVPDGSVSLDHLSIGDDTTLGSPGITGAGLILRNLPMTAGASRVSDFEVNGVGGVGIFASASPISLEDGSISRTGSHGLQVSGATADVVDVTVNSSTGSGMLFESANSGVSGSHVSGSTRYALECSGLPLPLIATCDDNELEAGDLGIVLDCGGCSATNPGDTDSDTDLDTDTDSGTDSDTDTDVP